MTRRFALRHTAHALLAASSLLALGCASGARSGTPVYTLANVVGAAPLLKYDRAECTRVFGGDFFLEEAPGGLKCVRETLDPGLQKELLTHRHSYQKLAADKESMSQSEFEKEAQKIQAEASKSVQRAAERFSCPNGSSLASSDKQGTVRCETAVFARSGTASGKQTSRTTASKESADDDGDATRPCAKGWSHVEIETIRGAPPLQMCAFCPRGLLDRETTNDLNRDEAKFKVAGCPTDRPCVICKHQK